MTERLFYADQHLASFEATVISCTENKGKYEVILDKTAFYPEGGGQPGDTGTLGGAEVLNTTEKGEEIIHHTAFPLTPGETVCGKIDWLRRFDFMLQHSGEHIVSGILNRYTGCHNVGFHMGADVVTIDFDVEISDEILKQAEKEANEAVWKNLPIIASFPTPEELKTIPYRSKKELEGEVRIVTIPGADICACCGTHVSFAGEIGLIKLISSRKFREGVRIEMVSGKRAYDYMTAVFEQNKRISNLLSAKPLETSLAVSRMMGENEKYKQREYEVQEKMIAKKAEELKGENDVLLFEEDLVPENVRKLCDAVAKVITGRCAVFSGNDEDGYKYAIISREDIRAFTKKLNEAFSGRGGGKPDFVQGSVKGSKKDIEEFFKEN